MLRYAILAGLVALAALAIYHPAPKPPAVSAPSSSLFTPPSVVAQAPSHVRHRARRRTSHRRVRRRAHHRRRLRPAVADPNTSSVSQLGRVPGLGPALAARIVTMRSLEGPFTSLDQLLDVAGMTAQRLARATPYLRLVRRPNRLDER